MRKLFRIGVVLYIVYLICLPDLARLSPIFMLPVLSAKRIVILKGVFPILVVSAIGGTRGITIMSVLFFEILLIFIWNVHLGELLEPYYLMVTTDSAFGICSMSNQFFGAGYLWCQRNFVYLYSFLIAALVAIFQDTSIGVNR